MRPDMVAVIREINELERKVYEFWFYDQRMTLYLNAYTYEFKETKRQRKWRTKEAYHRLAGYHERRGHVEPQIPEDVAAEARQKFAELVKVEIWPEREKRRW